MGIIHRPGKNSVISEVRCEFVRRFLQYLNDIVFVLERDRLFSAIEKTLSPSLSLTHSLEIKIFVYSYRLSSVPTTCPPYYAPRNKVSALRILFSHVKYLMLNPGGPPSPPTSLSHYHFSPSADAFRVRLIDVASYWSLLLIRDEQQLFSLQRLPTTKLGPGLHTRVIYRFTRFLSIQLSRV